MLNSWPKIIGLFMTMLRGYFFGPEPMLTHPAAIFWGFDSLATAGCD
jgi:hypothetical protein